GAVPPVGPTNASHGSPIASRALQDRVPGPVFTTATLSWFTPRLPTAAESLTWSGARARVATGGGVLVSLSTWQVASRMGGGAGGGGGKGGGGERGAGGGKELVQWAVQDSNL